MPLPGLCGTLRNALLRCDAAQRDRDHWMDCCTWLQEEVVRYGSFAVMCDTMLCKSAFALSLRNITLDLLNVPL